MKRNIKNKEEKICPYSEKDIIIYCTYNCEDCLIDYENNMKEEKRLD